ncbi:MAG TPA: protein-glutamate O-methyltransferase CheR, partial [Micavibrio sp.]
REATKTIRIWSAACSSGQEAYSTAIVVSEFLQDKPGWKCQIIGTDISEDILKIARAGEYNQFEVQRGLTIQMMVKYFTQAGTSWAIKDHLKSMVRFQQGNLLESSATLGMFDVVFCRNVLIYFNPETKASVLNGIAKRLSPDGFLLLGACETVLGLSTPFEAVQGLHGVQKLKVEKDQIQKSANL